MNVHTHFLSFFFLNTVYFCVRVDCSDRFLCKADERKQAKSCAIFFACFLKYVLRCRETTKPRWEPDVSFHSDNTASKNLTTTMKVRIMKDVSGIPSDVTSLEITCKGPDLFIWEHVNISTSSFEEILCTFMYMFKNIVSLWHWISPKTGPLL